MSTAPERFAKLRWLQNVACVAALIAGGLLAGLGLIGFDSSGRIWMVAGGGSLVFAAVMLMTAAPLLIKLESTLSRLLSEVRDLNEAVDRHAAHLVAIAENTQLSDAAKSLARRDMELEALRSAIRTDIRGERWEAAMNLIEEVEGRFGYKEEAERIRAELDDARNDRIQVRLTEAIELIESHFQSHEWERAQSEIDRVLHAIPNDSRVTSLQDRMRSLQEKHKEELKCSWDEAVRRTDTDQAIDILKELDQYLSPAEAKALQMTARTVFKEKLLRLGIQFRFAVNEKRWQDALDTGLEIIRDYPNARMANEVREAIDALRERARQGGITEPA